MHDQLEVHLDKIADEEVDPNSHLGEGRMLATSLGGIRLYVDWSMSGVSGTTLAYLKQIMTATVNFWFKTLSVPQLSILKIPESSESMCGGLSVPSNYRTTGVAADMVFFITSENSLTGFVAWSRACKQLASTGRPIVGQVNFNLNSMTGDNFISDLMVVVHETTHALGFSDSLFGSYTTPAQIGTVNYAGNTYSYVSAEPLNTKLKAYLGCSSVPGAIMENQGGSGSAGSHWERRLFGDEYMTASQINDQRVSELTLAMLDSSGWYLVDYSNADPFFYGKGEGCGYLNAMSGYKEFCSSSGEGCTFHGQAGAYCASDSFSDNANYWRAYSNRDCTLTSSSSSGTLSAEAYGQASKCFTGTLYPGGSLSSTTGYCFTYTCAQSSSGAYELKVHVGSSTGICTAKGSITVSGYSGVLNCPDPTIYCSTIGQPACRRGCMGKGTCAGGVCSCYAGWGSYDCSIKTASSLVDGVEKSQAFNYADMPDGYVPNNNDAPEYFGEGPDYDGNY
jgi:leishmanolysin